MIIRKAELSDLNELLEIYNYEVVNGVATLDIRPRTYEERLVWFNEHNIGNHPLIVADIDGTAVGYASLSSYREKEAYASTVELSVYIAPSFRKMGVATALMENILTLAKEDDTIHNVVSVITSGNEASIKLHNKFGFRYFGKMNKAAIKFDRFIDVEFFELLV